MPDLKTKNRLKSLSIEATIIRKDGTIEPLGEISYYHKNPLKRFMWKLKRWIKGAK